MTSAVEAYELSFDVIYEILTWLPVKSLLRFKCVCKQWCSLITEDRKFIAQQLDRATPRAITYTYEREDSCIVEDCGLLLEKGDDFGCRIRNPATQQVLYLPYADEDVRLLHLYYDLVTGECKVVRRRKLDSDLSSYEFEVITAGKDDQWRPICNGKSLWGLHLSYEADRYTDLDWLFMIFATDSEQDLEIYSFDMRSECITTNTVPRGAFTDMRKVCLLYCNGCLASGVIENEALSVLVLEDFKDHKWSNNKIVVPLKFMKDDPDIFQSQHIEPRSFYSDNLYFVMLVNGVKKSISYDTRTETITSTTDVQEEEETLEPRKERTKFYTPSLVTIKGMSTPENAGPIASDIST